MDNGFSIKTIEFLFNLRANNNKEWFHENRYDYETHLLNPMRELVKALGDTIHGIDPRLDTRPFVGKTISRINRDTRFSNDKSIYRARMWISFKQIREDALEFPLYFFELDPEYYCYGLSIYRAEKTVMEKFRELIKDKPDKFLEAASFFYSPGNVFSLEGEAYKRLDTSGVRDELKQWYMKKAFYLECLRPIDKKLFTGEYVEDIKEGFKAMAPLYDLLCGLHGEKR